MYSFSEIKTDLKEHYSCHTNGYTKVYMMNGIVLGMDLDTCDKITTISLTVRCPLKWKQTGVVNKINVGTKNVNIFILTLLSLAYCSIHSSKYVHWGSH